LTLDRIFNSVGVGRRGRRAEGSATGEFKCRVRWDRSTAYIPKQVYRDFLTLDISKYRPTLELCVSTDACADGQPHT